MRLREFPKRTLVGLIRLYQRYISPLSGPRCRFYPSCSRYAVEALEIHGVFKGTGLAAWRLLRCNPWNLGGVDDVPPKKNKP
ncbi:membrane protein insertion efficiency factor YidD [Populibacterium corticicola]|uniref:Putative membrane protein insertion efficiency factor n=1 Tax=Populibacterium corticicola TaxID=1812826 RepID=A0ABW5XFJ3_9MICO